MSGKKNEDENWAGKGFSRRNEESAPEPKGKPEEDEEDWIFQ